MSKFNALEMIHNSYPCGIYSYSDDGSFNKDNIGMLYPRSTHNYEPFPDASRLVLDFNIQSFLPGVAFGVIIGLLLGLYVKE